ncbi:G/U mismatch-specific DNA glycosylase [soil metagenome]
MIDPAVEPVAQSLPDVLTPGLVVVFVGLNPGAGSAAVGRNFANPSNRFWKTLHGAGFTPDRLSAEDDQTLTRFGCGLTTAVSRPTRSAGELQAADYRADAEALRAKIKHYRPNTVAFLGKAAFATISRSPRLEWGSQTATFADASVWILPNPSGLNRAFSLSDLSTAYGELRHARDEAFGAWRRAAG